MNNIPGFLKLKNNVNKAKWQWRWHAQGGCFHWAARDLLDWRNDAERKAYRRLELKVRQIRRHSPTKNVINLARLRIERARKRA